MTNFLHSIDWKSLGMAALSWTLTVVVLYAIIPNLTKIPQLTGKLFDWLEAQEKHVSNQYASGVLVRLSTLAKEAVLVMENTAIEDLKTLASTGTLSMDGLKTALDKVKTDTVTMVQTHATAQELWSDALYVVAGKEDALKMWLGDVVEAHVASLPSSGLQTVHPMLEARGNLSAIEQGLEVAKKFPANPPSPAA